MSKLVVHKYGGSSLSTPELIKSIAQKVNQLRKDNTKIIMVVSAMGTHTNELIKLAHQVSPTPNPRELDMLLTTGERVSMALMCMALNDLDCPSISFTGSQAGILTDGSHNDATILNIKPIRIEEELKGEKVIVIAGFQGVDPKTKEITTLGRGGSDTTAVALAAHFGASSCEVFKDTDGVYSADPNSVDGTIHYDRLSYSQAMKLSANGAKVLHHKCVEFAKEKQTPIIVSASHYNGKTTLISGEAADFEPEQCYGVTTSPVDENEVKAHLIFEKNINKGLLPQIEEAFSKKSIEFEFTDFMQDTLGIRLQSHQTKPALQILHDICINSSN